MRDALQDITYTRRQKNLAFNLLLIIPFFSLGLIRPNPQYGLLAVIIFISCALSLHIIGRHKKTSKNSLLFILLYTALLITTTIGAATTDFTNAAPQIITLSLSLPLFLVGKNVGQRLNNKSLSVRRLASAAVILFFIIEAGTRFVFPDHTETRFYKFKSSWLFFDSNFTAYYIGIFLLLTQALKTNKGRVPQWGQPHTLTLLLLMCLTVSRAGIIAIAATLLLSRTRALKRMATILFIFGCATYLYIALHLPIYADQIRALDGSFYTKFSIAHDAFQQLQNVPNLLLGIGPGNSRAVLGVYTHNFIITSIMEFGAIGSLLLLYLFYLMYSRDSWPLYFYFFLSGMSVFTLSIPPLYFACGILKACADKKPLTTNTVQ